VVNTCFFYKKSKERADNALVTETTYVGLDSQPENLVLEEVERGRLAAMAHRRAVSEDGQPVAETRNLVVGNKNLMRGRRHPPAPSKMHPSERASSTNAGS